jgi:hypothetical protein
MEALGSLNWLAVAAAAASTFLLGGLWYGPLFGRAWMRASGMTAEKAKQGKPGLVFGLSFALQLLAALVLAMFLGPRADLAFGLAAGGAAGLFWVATALGVVYLFEQRPLAHWTVNAGYCVVAFLIMGGILGAWR